MKTELCRSTLKQQTTKSCFPTSTAQAILTTKMWTLLEKLDGVSAAAVIFLSLFTLLAWRRYMSPLGGIPGPFVASWTRFWHMHRILLGDQNNELVRLHRKNGTKNSKLSC